MAPTAPPEAEQRAAKIASLKLEGAAAIERRERLAAALKDATQRRMCDSSDDSLLSDECEASDEQAELADEALLPSELLTADSVAVPALLEDNLLDLPNPRYASQNAAVLITAASSAVLVVAMSVAEFAPPGTSILGLLRRLPLSLWASYLRAVAAYPVAVKAALTGVTYVIGDMIAQVVQQQQQILQLQLAPRSLRDSLLRMDVWRYARAGLAGVVFLGPLAHVYYDLVAHFCAGWPTLAKVALDQTLYLALYNSIYYLTLGRLAGRPLLEVARQYSAQFWRLLRAGWKLWPFVGVITYTYVPTAHRVLFVDLVEIAYSAILSTMTTDTPPAEGEAEPLQAETFADSKRDIRP